MAQFDAFYIFRAGGARIAANDMNDCHSIDKNEAKDASDCFFYGKRLRKYWFQLPCQNQLEYSLHGATISRFRRMMTIEQFRSPELAALYSGRYVERVLDYHAGIFSALIAVGEIRAEDSAALAMMYAAPVLTLIGVCDRQPEREGECLKRLERHVCLFFRMVHGTP